eukprot:3000828-Amphidinium_carterae.1
MSDRARSRFGCSGAMAFRRSQHYIDTAYGTERGVSYVDDAFDRRTFDAYGSPFSRSECISAYTAETDLYKEVNLGLRINSKELDTHREFMYHLKEEMKEDWRGGLKYEGEVYRGLNMDQAVLDEYTPGLRFLWPAFTSTSKQQTVAEAFEHNVLAQIDCDGLGVTYAVDIEKKSKYPWEQE